MVSRRSTAHAREYRERVNRLVRERIGAGIICGRCGARYVTLADKCDADLGERCPGANAIELQARLAEQDMEWP